MKAGMMGGVIRRFSQYIKSKLHSDSIRRKLLLAFLGVAIVPMAIMGGFSVISLFRTTADNAVKSIDDKLRIANLLWNVRMDDMASTSRTIAQDNMVILNMDLGLYQSLGTYLNNVRARNDLTLAFILDSQGNLVANAGQEYVPSMEQPVPEAMLAKAVEGAMLVAMRLGGSSLLAGGSLSALDADKELSLLAIHPIINFNQVLSGYAVSAMVFGLAKGEGSSAFFAALQDQVGIPVLLTHADRLIASSSDAKNITLPTELATAGANSSWSSGFNNMMIDGASFMGRFHTVKELDGSGITIGVVFPESSYLFDRNLTVAILLGVILAAFLVTVVVGLTISRNIASPIVAMSEGAREIVNGNFNVRISVPSRDEIGLMAEEFNQMTVRLSETMQRLAREVEEHQWAERQVRKLNDELELRVLDRTKELTSANEALAESLSLLRRTQKHLVETEKLAALGNLVSGMAHELNTPIGVSMTAASFLQTRTKELERLIAGNELTRQSMSSYIREVNEAAALLGTNLARTAEQIRFFKQIAIDQETGVSGEIDLHAFVEEFNASLAQHLRKGGHGFRNLIDPGIVLTTWPGPLYQVLSNLAMNALQHGFHEREGGTISYRAERTESRLVLELSDDGVGIPADSLHRIFDPFFTTKRGNGRTGLGLSIVYNLVTVKLGGEIDCQSTIGQGTTFRISLPLGSLELLDRA